MSLLSVLATVIGTIGGLANLPQAYKIFKRKSAKDISILTYSIIFMGCFIWALYGVEIQNYPLIISNTFGTITVTLVIIGWFLYGRS
jgi:MtN3 and saliva related transmembrane protein